MRLTAPLGAASPVWTLFLLPGGRPRRLVVTSDIQAGGRPRRRPRPCAKPLQAHNRFFDLLAFFSQLSEDFADIHLIALSGAARRRSGASRINSNRSS